MQYIQLQGQVASALDTPLEGGFNLFIDTNDGTIKAKDSGGNLISAGGGLVETTYNQLTASLDSGSLTPGTYYKITDFKTCYDQPNYNYDGSPITTGNYKTGSVSPIIVFALDSGSLAADAFQPEHPNDNIKYDISFNQTEVTSNPAFGRIVYRKDDRGNAMDYDFREVYFKRYDAYVSDNMYNGTISLSMTGSSGFISGSGTTFDNFSSGSVVGVLDFNNNPIVTYYAVLEVLNDYGMVVTGSAINTVTNKRLVNANTRTGLSWKKSNIISNTNEYEYLTFDADDCFNNVSTNNIAFTNYDEFTFLLPNNVFRDGSYRDNSFACEFRNNTFNDDFDSNTITDRFYNNSINDDFDNNIINGPFYNNIIDVAFQQNLIMDSFYNNNFGDDDGTDFDNNTFKGSFFNNFNTGYGQMSYNTFNKDFSNNIILRQFNDNTISNAYDNEFRQTFNDNIIGDNFYGNTFYSSVASNTISANCYNNIIHPTFNDNTIGSYFFNNTLGELGGEAYFEYNHIGYEFRGNQILGDFLKNRIADFFYNNTIAWNFQYNDIKTELNGVDFTQYYGNIMGGVTFTNGIAGTNGTYTEVTGSTTGIGVNAEFEIIVENDVVTTVNVTNEGKFYQSNDTITIASGSFGGSADLVLTEDGISSLPEVYKNYNKTIQKAWDDTNVLTVILPGEGYFPYITSNITQAINF